MSSSVRISVSSASICWKTLAWLGTVSTRPVSYGKNGKGKKLRRTLNLLVSIYTHPLAFNKCRLGTQLLPLSNMLSRKEAAEAMEMLALLKRDWTSIGEICVQSSRYSYKAYESTNFKIRIIKYSCPVPSSSSSLPSDRLTYCVGGHGSSPW